MQPSPTSVGWLEDPFIPSTIVSLVTSIEKYHLYYSGLFAYVFPLERVGIMASLYPQYYHSAEHIVGVNIFQLNEWVTAWIFHV